MCRDGCRRHHAASIQQTSRLHLKRFGQLLDDSDRRIPPPALNVTDIGAVDAGAVGIVLLAPAFGHTEAADIETQARANIHGCVKTAVSPFDLQTMSDISR